jgi:hypothetical protein
MKYKGIIIDEISAFAHTSIYIELLCYLVADMLQWLKNIVMTRALLILGIFLSWMAIVYVPFL